jgi:hypothetical protein
MPTAENAILYYEAGQDPVAMVALTDQGDLTDFKSADTMFSNRSGYEPDVKPNGLANGGVITPAVSGSNDVIDISAMNVYIAGVLTAVGATTDEAITRPTVSNYQKFSITVTALGAVAVVEGSEHTEFSATRGAAGGPPYIDNDAVEIGQVWYSSQTPAAVLASEIKQVPGVSLERWDYPVWQIEYVDVSNGVLGYAGVKFNSALQGIHSEDAGVTVAGKLIYAAYNTPVFAEVVDAYDFVPPANAHTVNTTQVYGRTKGSKSQTLNQGSFNVEFSDGISDGLLRFVDDTLWFKFLPDRLKSPYVLAQGSLGVGPSFPAGANINAACTISAEAVGDRVYS